MATRKKKTKWELPSIQNQMEIVKLYPEAIAKFNAEDWSVGSQYLLITQLHNLELLTGEQTITTC